MSRIDIEQIMRDSGVTPRPEYYSGRGPNYKELSETKTEIDQLKCQMNRARSGAQDSLRPGEHLVAGSTQMMVSGPYGNRIYYGNRP